MKTKILLTAALALAGTTAQARPVYDEAEVLDSRPVYRTVEISSPREECWQEDVVRHGYDEGYRSHTPSIVGAVVGGALGNAVGHKKSNRRVGTVVGAVLGGSIGRDLGGRAARDTVVYHDTVEHCRMVESYHQEEKLVGYDVRYRYNGRDYSIRLPRDPGPSLRVKVDIEPVY